MPAVTVITTAFTKAAELRARALGLPEHPVVVIEHPIASKTGEQIKVQARDSVQSIADGLTSASNGRENGGRGNG